VGLRGAGKSTIGARLGAVLEVPFVELDHQIESAAGLALTQIFEIHGESYYRRLERERVSQLVKKHAPPVVIAAGGGLVSHRETWSLLVQKARTVWLKARPEDHYKRVMAQGDLRPMENRPAAMAELRAILSARATNYAEAELTVDTSALGLEGAVERIMRWLRQAA
jgi:XRE family aerobic/anaerobic benzoate catabolism transcriptional regulator